MKNSNSAYTFDMVLNWGGRSQLYEVSVDAEDTIRLLDNIAGYHTLHFTISKNDTSRIMNAVKGLRAGTHRIAGGTVLRNIST